MPPATKARLWHPLSSGTSEVQQWRQRIFDLGVRQPFRQAYRDFYEVTEDERQTKMYSNRFAGILMRQHQFSSLCRASGWNYRLMGSAFDGFNVPTKPLAPWNMHAEFYVDLPSDRKPSLSESAVAEQSDFGINLFLGSDQVRFYRDRREIGVSRQGYINQSVKVRPRLRDSGLVAGEAPWSESKTVKPSDNMLRKGHAQHIRLQRTVNADVASLHANPVAETVDNARKQQEPTETSPMRRLSPAGYQRRHDVKEDVSTGEALGARRRNLAEEVSAITVSGKCRYRHQGDGSGRTTVDGRAAKRARREGPGPVSIPLVKVRQG